MVKLLTSNVAPLATSIVRLNSSPSVPPARLNRQRAFLDDRAALVVAVAGGRRRRTSGGGVVAMVHVPVPGLDDADIGVLRAVAVDDRAVDDLAFDPPVARAGEIDVTSTLALLGMASRRRSPLSGMVMSPESVSRLPDCDSMLYWLPPVDAHDGAGPLARAGAGQRRRGLARLPAGDLQPLAGHGDARQFQRPVSSSAPPVTATPVASVPSAVPSAPASVTRSVPPLITTSPE